MPKLNILRVKLFKNFEFDFLQDVILFNFASRNTSWVLFSNVLLNTFNSLTYNPIITKKLFPINKKDLLSNEEINGNALNLNQMEINYNDNENMTNEIIKNKKQEKELMNKIQNIQLKINRVKEQLKMLKEDKRQFFYQWLRIIT